MLIGVLVTMLSFSSCTDQDDVEISYGTTMTVSASHIFDSFQAVQTNDFNLSDYSGWEIEMSSYIYDDAGNLVDETSQSSNNLNNPLNHELKLLPGKYKAISIARFGKQEGTDLSFYWQIKNNESLSTLTIEEAEEAYMQFTFETLGVIVSEISIDNKPQNINIEIPPVTGLLEVFFWGEDMTGFGNNGYSEMAPYCQEINIWAPNLKQQVKFSDGSISYDYGVQNKEYRIAKFTPKQRYLNGQTPNEYNYRALLPIRDRDFYWDITFDRGKGSQFGLNDFQESDYTTKISIESGIQYDLDLLFDGKYLFVQEHVADEDLTKRKERLIQELNVAAFNQIMDRNFDTFIGQSQSVIDNTFGTGSVSGNSIYYFDYNLYVQALVFGMDQSTNTVKTISIMFQNLNDDFSKRLVDYLTNRFTVFEKGTDQHTKAFINASTLEDATIGITWNIDDSLLTYVKLK